MAELTDKQKMFIKEYLIDLNGSAAYLRAGYKSKQPHVDCQKLLVNSSIKEEIQKAMDERARKTEISAEYVLKGIKQIADDAERDNDKLKAYELLGKHLKLFTDKIEHSGEISYSIKDPFKGEEGR